MVKYGVSDDDIKHFIHNQEWLKDSTHQPTKKWGGSSKPEEEKRELVDPKKK